jgi:exosortase
MQQDDNLIISNKEIRQDSSIVLWIIIFALTAVTLWAYWPVITDLFDEWQSDDDYSAGQLVPITALFLVWKERKKLKESTLSPFWYGLILLFAAQASRLYGLIYMYESAERYSLVLMVAGLVIMVAGLDVFKRTFWIIMFLFLMVPFPGQIHNLISGPLQKIATSGSVFLLEAFGANVSRQGNIVSLNRGTTMAVEEACSGLRMLTAFIIVAAFIAYMVKRSRFQKAFVLFSSIPIAVMCNIIRLCITAVLFMLVSSQAAEKFFHDFAGVTMMPAAVIIIFFELWLLKILTTTESPEEKIIISSKLKSSNSQKER